MSEIKEKIKVLDQYVLKNPEEIIKLDEHRIYPYPSFEEDKIRKYIKEKVQRQLCESEKKNVFPRVVRVKPPEEQTIHSTICIEDNSGYLMYWHNSGGLYIVGINSNCIKGLGTYLLKALFVVAKKTLVKNIEASTNVYSFRLFSKIFGKENLHCKLSGETIDYEFAKEKVKFSQIYVKVDVSKINFLDDVPEVILK